MDAIENHVMQLPEFTHAVHVKLAYCYLTQMSFEDSVKMMSRTLVGFLKKHGVDRKKFHVTLTTGWLKAVAHFMYQSPATTSADDFIKLNPVLLNKQILLSHYSHELLFSELARVRYIEPDLNPFPNA